MNVNDILDELRQLGDSQTLKTFRSHGAPSNCYGVKIGELKKHLLKKVKKNQALCIELFATGNTDAQYLAGLAINPKLMTKDELKQWATRSNWSAIDESIVAGVAAESDFSLELAREWMASTDARLQNMGWVTYGKYLSLTTDDKLQKEEISHLLTQIKKEIHTAPNTIRYSMNQFIIYVGVYYAELSPLACEVAQAIKDVDITLPTKGCRLPDPIEKIQKARDKNKIGIKRKKVVC